MDRKSKLYDPSVPDRERAEYLVSLMTREEKLGCFTLRFNVERLGLMLSVCAGEGAHGVQARAGQRETYPPTMTTSFTQPIGMAATFDRALIREAGDVMGRESRAFENAVGRRGHLRLCPTVDLCRDPRWGRTEEGYGEDPYLTGKMASAYIRGMQDERRLDGRPLRPDERGDRIRTGAVLKHFYANNQEYRRTVDSFDVSDKVKYDCLLEPFRYCAEQGHAEGVMTSYNSINGVPAMLNHEVRDLLKRKWGIRYAMTDGGDFLQTVELHHYYKTHAETLAEGVRAGIDAMLDAPDAVYQAAREALERGLISEEELDRAAVGQIMELLRQGFFDPEDPYAALDMSDVGTKEAARVSLKVSEAANVLLKNESGFLPLDREDDIALIGHTADRWYMDWYGGKPMYRVTLREGVERELGRPVPYDSGLDRVCFRVGDRYLGARTVDGDVCLALTDRQHALELERTDWGEGSNFLYAPAYGKYLTAREDGRICLASDEPFAWHVYESFTIAAADAKALPEPRNANCIAFDRYWEAGGGDVRLYCFGKRSVYIRDGVLVTDPLRRLRPQGAAKEGGNEADAWAGSTVEAAVLTAQVVSSGAQRACALAAKASKVIVSLGCDPVVNAKEEIDRGTIAMIPAQERLAEAVCAANPSAAVVLITNYPYAIGRLDRLAPAILTCATGSQEMGSGLASALFGRSDPAGRLPMTWYRSDLDLPALDDYDLIGHPRTYRYFDGPVLYPFGYGLSYTTFDYSRLCVERDGEGLNVRVDVTNTGARRGDEVAQLYLCRVSPSETVHPLKRLIGFERLHDLEPGERRTALFRVDPCDLAVYVESQGVRMVEPGRYRLFAGGSSRDERVDALIDL